MNGDKMNWTTIKVPVDIKMKIQHQARIENVPMHVIVEKAFNVYMIHLRDVGGQPFLKGKRHSKGMWYAWKLLLSYAEYRTAVKNRLENIEDYRKAFHRTLTQLRERVKIITPKEYEEIQTLMRYYEKTLSNKFLYKHNDFIRDIFFRCIA